MIQSYYLNENMMKGREDDAKRRNKGTVFSKRFSIVEKLLVDKLQGQQAVSEDQSLVPQIDCQKGHFSWRLIV